MKLKRRFEVESVDGLSLTLAGIIVRRLSRLRATVSIFAPSGEGKQWACKGVPSPMVMRELARLGKDENIVCGDMVTVITEGERAEVAMEEIRLCLTFTEPESHDFCKFMAAKGPRGEWYGIPDSHVTFMANPDAYLYPETNRS